VGGPVLAVSVPPPITCVGVLQTEQRDRVTGLQTAVWISQEAQEEYMHAI